MTRVLVCGGRDFRDVVLMGRVMKQVHLERNITCVIHGDYRGADRHADIWARWNRIAVEPYPAKWKEQGRAAGPIRNRRMIDEGKPDLVVAFPGHDGTNDMIEAALEAGIEVMVVTP